MSYQEKNISVSLVTSFLILGYFLIRVFFMIQNGEFESTHVFRLWGIIIGLAILGNILATILTHIVSAIIEAIKTQGEPDIEDFEDERDSLIDLRSTKVTYGVFSVGVLLSMLSYVLGQPPLVMFTALIISGFLAQIIGDTIRLYMYRRGF